MSKLLKALNLKNMEIFQLKQTPSIQYRFNNKVLEFRHKSPQSSWFISAMELNVFLSYEIEK